MERTWEEITSSFWFIPSLMSIGSFVLFSITQHLDRVTQSNLTQIPMLPVVFSGGTNGAAAMVGLIAGSLITVMTTAFSVTIVALQLASSNYSPRLLRSFSADRGVQLVLGGFVATFVYSLLVLRAISAYKSANIEVSPAISVTVTVLLALVCVMLVIYFIQHAANLIQSTNIVRRAHRDTMRAVSRLDDSYKAGSDISSRKPLCYEVHTGRAWLHTPLQARARKSGYLQHIEVDFVARAVAAGSGTTFVEFLYGPGDFIPAGSPVARVWRDRGIGSEPHTENALLKGLVVGKERSLRQDFAFGLRQLSDIALKGLSPSLNDPTTAIQALDRLEAVFLVLGNKTLPQNVRRREINGGRVLIKVGYPDFDELVGVAFDQARRAALATGQVAVLERYLQVMDSLIRETTSSERGQALWARTFSVARMAPRQLPDPQDAVELMCQVVGIGGRLLEGAHGAAVGSDLEELVVISEEIRGSARVQEAVDATRSRGTNSRRELSAKE